MGAGERIIIQTLELPQHNGKCALDMVMVLASFAAAHTQFSSLPLYENVFFLSAFAICIQTRRNALAQLSPRNYCYA